MPLDDTGMHRLGLGFIYRMTPVIVVSILYGMYIATLCVATRGLWQRGLSNRTNAMVFLVLYLVFLVSTALWALELAQLVGLDEILLSPDGLETEGLFNRFYALVARETKITGVLFECQMILGDILVIWRSSAIWFDRRVVVLIPIFWWALMIVNMIVHASFCQSGFSATNYSQLCKGTDIAAPVLSILVNVSVMVLTLWKAWLLREMLRDSFRRKRTTKLFPLFVLLIESGTLYVVMLIADLLVTSLVTGSTESAGHMIDCFSGYATVQFVGIYPTLMLVVLRESIWNDDSESHSRGSSIGIGIGNTGEQNDKRDKARSNKSAEVQVLSVGSRMHFAMRTETQTDTKLESTTLRSIGDVNVGMGAVQRSVAVQFVAEGSNGGSAEKENYRGGLAV